MVLILTWILNKCFEKLLSYTNMMDICDYVPLWPLKSCNRARNDCISKIISSEKVYLHKFQFVFTKIQSKPSWIQSHLVNNKDKNVYVCIIILDIHLVYGCLVQHYCFVATLSLCLPTYKYVICILDKRLFINDAIDLNDSKHLPSATTFFPLQHPIYGQKE